MNAYGRTSSTSFSQNGYAGGVSGPVMGSGGTMDDRSPSINPYAGKAVVNQLKSGDCIMGGAFRQLLVDARCSQSAITYLENENLADSAILLALTPSEFEALPLSVGDKKRIEIALRTLAAA